jgi:hypothetical protein
MNAQQIKQRQEDERWLKSRELQMQNEGDKYFLAQFPKVPKKDPSTPKIIIKSSNPQSYLVRTSNMTLQQKNDEIQRMMKEKDAKEAAMIKADMERLINKYRKSGGRKMRKTRKGAKKNKKYTIKMNNRKMKKKTYKRR